MKVIFLNIDNTFWSGKAFLATGKMPQNLNPENRECFDWISVGLLRRLCQHRDIKIVVQSHLANNHSKEALEKYFNLPILDVIKTEQSVGELTSLKLEIVQPFEQSVGKWIINNQFAGDYLIIDTASKMDFISFIHFIIVDSQEGFLYKNYLQICEYFTIAP